MVGKLIDEGLKYLGIEFLRRMRIVGENLVEACSALAVSHCSNLCLMISMASLMYLVAVFSVTRMRLVTVTAPSFLDSIFMLPKKRSVNAVLSPAFKATRSESELLLA